MAESQENDTIILLGLKVYVLADHMANIGATGFSKFLYKMLHRTEIRKKLVQAIEVIFCELFS